MISLCGVIARRRPRLGRLQPGLIYHPAERGRWSRACIFSIRWANSTPAARVTLRCRV